ncbi:MAG: SDR family oxidoreductase [Proteobacteria bacterium]|nr:SDR family oxidoreductase [Pseudomonadota bacterium]
MTVSMFDLKGAVALVTGAGSGIGRATAKALGAHGAKVAVTELAGRGDLTKSLVEELSGGGVEAMAISLDVRASMTISHVMSQVQLHFGTLDILVNNAGTQLFKAALDIDEEEFDEVMNVNLKGAFLCSQAAAAIMVDQKRGCIINVASQHGVVGNRMRAPYCASKGGLINLTRALAIEWAEFGIRVNAISPTFVENETNRHLIENSEFKQQIQQGVLLGRAATPTEVAAGICYLASPAAAMVTGHNLLIDGGWTAH